VAAKRTAIGPASNVARIAVRFDPAAPSAPRFFQIFAGLARQHLMGADDAVIQTFSPELTKLQQVVLGLLGVPESSYR
jgi:hypothetical protein